MKTKRTFEIDASDDFDGNVKRFIGNLLAAQEGQGGKALEFWLNQLNQKF